MGVYMDFSFHWTNQKDGNYAIQKRDIGKRGENNFIEAGKAIERKEKQTSKTHYFLTIDNGLWEMSKINRILKTITYNYVYKGTNRKAIRQYLKKTDIEKVLNNITEYENKTIKINITPPIAEQIDGYKERQNKIKSNTEKIIEICKKIYGETKAEKLFGLVIQRGDKNKELKKRKKEASAEIKKTIERITENMKRFEKMINADVEEIDKSISAILRSARKGYKNIDGIDSKILSLTAKTYKQQKERNERQKKYRERKNAEKKRSKER
jgi:hypothetical protein